MSNFPLPGGAEADIVAAKDSTLVELVQSGVAMYRFLEAGRTLMLSIRIVYAHQDGLSKQLRQTRPVCAALKSSLTAYLPCLQV